MKNKEIIIECNKCHKEYDYYASMKCIHCGEYQTTEDDDYANGNVYPAHETWED